MCECVCSRTEQSVSSAHDTGTKFSAENIITQYENLLRRVVDGELKLGKMISILDSVLNDPHVFRSTRQTAASKKLMQTRRQHIQKIIDECKAKAAVLKTKNREARHSTRKVDPVLGQRVLVPGSRWNLGGYFAGTVTRRGKFRPRRERKSQVGYCVKYVYDDKTEWWLIEDLEQYFVHGDMTAETNPDLTDIRVHDRVYASWQSGDEWYYGTVEKVNSENADAVNTYKIRFDDGTSESNVLPEHVQFIARPDVIVNDKLGSDSNNIEDAVDLLDTLGEKDVIDDVEIQEIWET